MNFASQYIRSPISGWMGGKFHLIKTIVPLIPQHICYVEPFFGAGWIFFNKAPSITEVINDYDFEIVNLLQCIREHKDELIARFNFLPQSRFEFERFVKMKPEDLPDIDRAVRFYYIQQTCMNGAYNRRKPIFNVSKSCPGRYNPERIEKDFNFIWNRLQHTRLENRDALDLIQLYDAENTFFYLDPPYYQPEGKHICYSNHLTLEDYKKLASILSNLKGKFILSLNNHEIIKSIFADFFISYVNTMWCCGFKTSDDYKKVSELLISNFELFVKIKPLSLFADNADKACISL